MHPIDLGNIHKPIFVTGIGTDVGKSYAVGHLAKMLSEQGIKVITQKFVQTGCTDSSEDIECHRRIMGIDMLPVDLDHTTAPIIFTYPASPDLAAKIDGKEIDFSLIERSSQKLLSEFDTVLLEGAGGLMVPLKDNYLTLDYIKDHKLPVILVTNGRLGSISDTLLNLKVIKSEKLDLIAVVYNTYFDDDKTIAADTKSYISTYLKGNFPNTPFITI